MHRIVQRGRAGVRQVGHVVDRHDDLQVERFALTGVDDRDGTGDVVLLPAEKARDLLERALRRGQADALHRCLAGARQAFHAERKVCAALGGRHRVDFIDDDSRRAGEDVDAAGGEQQIKALGRRDQNVRRCAQHPLSITLRRISGSHADADRRQLQPVTARGVGDAHKRAAQIALHVVVQRLER